MPPRHTLALLTIGQSPRHDYTPDLPALLPANTALTQHGALDALTLRDVRARLSPAAPDAARVLVSRMRDGTPVTMDAAKLGPLLEAAARRVDADADALLVLCTGDVPRWEGLRVPVVWPQEALRRWLEERAGDGTTGAAAVGPLLVVVSPDEKQVAAARGRWGAAAGWAASPYGEGSVEGVRAVAAEVAGWLGRREEKGGEVGEALVLLDCMGFTLEHKRVVEEVVGEGVEVVVPREVVFGAVRRLFGEV